MSFHQSNNKRPQVFYRLDGTEAATISREELQRCMGDQVDLATHVAEGRLLAGESLPVNAVALWAMQEAWHAALENSETLARERGDLLRHAYEDDLTHDTKDAVRKIFDRLRISVVHDGCYYPSWGDRPEWVAEWDRDTMRWWRHPRLAAEFVAYAPKMRAEFWTFIEGARCRRDRTPSSGGPRDHGPVERKVRELVHLYLVDVPELIASKLPRAKVAAV